MSGEQSWRTETNAGEYLGHQQKRGQLADRRPVIRRASDLVGPGIGVSAVRLTDLKDPLALCNGFFSARSDALDAPTSAEDFIGFCVVDAEIGGMQTFRGMSTGKEYVRMVSRSPSDPETLAWGNWVEQ